MEYTMKPSNIPFIISHPLYETRIPSTGAKVTMRPMLAREEKILLIAKTNGEYSEKLKAVTQILQACCNDVVINKLTMFDLEYLFVQLRAFSINNISQVSYKDLDDGKKYDFSINLYDINVKFPESVENPINVKDTDISIKLRYPSVETFVEMLDKKIDTYEDKLQYIIQRSVESISQGKKVISAAQYSTDDIQKFLDELPVLTWNKVKYFFESEPSLTHELKYTNASGDERTITLRTLDDFFTLV